MGIHSKRKNVNILINKYNLLWFFLLEMQLESHKRYRIFLDCCKFVLIAALVVFDLKFLFVYI